MMRLFMKTVKQHARELDLWMLSFNLWNYNSIGLLWEEVNSVLKDKYDSARRSGVKAYVKRKREKSWKLYYNNTVRTRHVDQNFHRIFHSLLQSN